MNKFAGLVIDSSDDVDGASIRSWFDIENIPDFVKSAERVDPIRTDLPDDNYALVLVDHGVKMKKYATTDKGNTALSVVYLLKQGHYLPPQAVKIAAQNLIEACGRFGLDIPEQLKLAASSGMSSIAGESQSPYIAQAYKKQRQAPLKEAEKESELNPQLGKGDPNQDVRKRTNMEPVMGSNFLEAPPFSTKERFSDTQGTSIDSEKLAYERHSMLGADTDTMSMFGPTAETRKRNWRTSPYVDVADWEPSAHLMQKKASAPIRTLLNGKYPVDSYDQVKTAEVYFKTHERVFHPRDRHTYCVKLAARMSELGIKAGEEIQKYAAEGYGDAITATVNFRKRYVDEQFHPALDTLLEKQAHVKPETFAEALEAFDKHAQIAHLWDSEIPDPWSSTYGITMVKIAEDEWSWDHNGVRVTEDDLENLSINGHHLVKKSFGDKFAEEFSKSPKSFFEALPLPNRLVLGRLAMDRYSGTGTE